MKIADSLLPEFDQEMKGTRRVLERVPDGKPDWKPHDKSMALGRLATHLAEIPQWTVNSLTKDGLDFDPKTYKSVILDKTADILALFDANRAKGREALANAPDADFALPWSLRMMGKEMFAGTRGSTYRQFCVSHMIHHRAQLGVYLRLLGVPVPGVYGPTADDQPRM
ncbi:MAG: DinB family protein [Gemmatimonadales bacterium]